ncbi:MAG TPA: four helix bundle protein [Bacteroidales bacterium]|nr:four helix bundle protein [Bacteroidales bacterium]HSA43199.1 four helix bundle protein [Bacteroidales bacterium]
MKNEKSEGVRSHNDLEVWMRAKALVVLIYKITRDFPKVEIYGLCSQLRRASVSVPTNIAEGFGRKHLKELIHFLYYSQGSLSEIETLIIISYELGYISQETETEIILDIKIIRIMLTRLIRSLEKPGNYPAKSVTS